MKVRIKKYPTYFGPYQFMDWLFYPFSKEGDFGREYPNWVEKFSEWYAESKLGSIHEKMASLWVEIQDRNRISVKIDKFDTWSMDDTLGYIIIPMLKQLKETKQGAPLVDDEDVPEMFRSTQDKDYDPKNEEGELDKFFFRRWEWVMDEMIWAFEASRDNYPYEVPFDSLKAVQDRIQNGYRLFGKHFSALWD